MPKDKVLKKQERLQEIIDLQARLWRRITRTVNAYERLEQERRRLLKPGKVDPKEYGLSEYKEEPKKFEEELNDPIPF
jgi:hypothetical protein